MQLFKKKACIIRFIYRNLNQHLKNEKQYHHSRSNYY